MEILKPPQDKRLYRRIQLASGMHVLLISDPEMAHSLEEETEAQAGEKALEGDSGSDSGSEEVCQCETPLGAGIYISNIQHRSMC